MQVCRTDEYGDHECEMVKTICKSSPSDFQYKSSTQCKDNNGKFCDSCKAREGYTYQKCSCSHVDSDYYSSSFYCKADNLILNWKNYYCKKGTIKFNYLNNAVPSNKECPQNTKSCGILDELGNKLCIKKNYACPINYVTLNSSDRNYTYKNYTIDGVTIYYTNEAINDGKILGGFYVDSDLMINYNIGDCQIITTGKISELLNSHANKLYRKSLTFNPYKDKNIDNKGKAYLKWCIPGVGKERNITLIKELMNIYEQNKTISEKLTSIKYHHRVSYFIGLSGYITTIILLIFTIFSLKYRYCTHYIVINSFIVVVLFLLLGEVGLSFNTYSDLSKLNKYNQNFLNVHIRLISINIYLYIIFIISMITFFCFSKEVDNYYNNSTKNYNIHENLIDKEITELKTKSDNNKKSSDTNIYKLTPDSLN